ncbi:MULTISPECIES: TonB-dependent siderophore receptor [unclassified Pseudoxanthomonas]|uniref:TonB-dependent siderophore receptor n=1 Tax=unclassified Pseudoxanthomonas TaxID=2645906 RepID=UPI0030776C99
MSITVRIRLAPCLFACLSLPWSAASLAQSAPSPVADAADDVTELDALEVVGRQDAGAYYADEASGAKSRLPLRELPQSVRILSRQAIDDLGATRLDDTLDYVGGVSRQNNFGGLWDNIAIRGLPGNENTGSSMLLNGFSGNRGFNAPRDMANIERLEFLKGPAAALYGSSEPGGTVNLVTKQPQWRWGHALEAYAGSHDSYRTALDSTGPLTEDFAYRLNMAAEDRGSFRDHIHSQRQFVAPAFAWRLGDATQLNYSGEWIRHQTPLDRGVVSVDGRLGRVSREAFLGEPGDGDITIRNQTHQLVLEHEWSEGWTSRAGLSYREGTLHGFSTEAHALMADGRTLRRQHRYRDYASEDVALQAELQGRFAMGGLQHELLVGTEAYDFSLDQRMLRINPSAANPYAIDILNPVYGQPRPDPLPNTDTREEQRNVALYVQDAIHLGERWRLMAGLRMDRYEQTLDNRRTGARVRQQPHENSPRIGLSYLPSEAWTLYVNAGRSFRPNIGTDAQANPFDPESGRAVEAGAKWQSASGQLGATLALFDIRKSNVVTADPANPGFSANSGEVRSRGVELDFSGQLSEHWRINSSFVYDQVDVLKDNTLEVDGSLINVPRINGSVLGVYENILSNGSRYGIGAGVTHMGERLGETRTQADADAGVRAFELPAYTTGKLVAYWRISPRLRLSLDVDNLLDETYYSSSVSRLWVTPGTGRTVTLGVQTKF